MNNMSSIEATPINIEKVDALNTSTESVEAKPLYKHLNTDEKRASKQYLDGFIASFYNCKENIKIEQPANHQSNETGNGKHKKAK